MGLKGGQDLQLVRHLYGGDRGYRVSVGSVWGQGLQLVRHLHRGHIGDIGSVYGIKGGSGSSAGTSPVGGGYGVSVGQYMGSIWGQSGVRIFSWYVSCRGLMGVIWGGDMGSVWGQYGVRTFSCR